MMPASTPTHSSGLQIMQVLKPVSGQEAQVCRLQAAYGSSMTYEQVASELGLSAVYVAKKIGMEKYSHLDWVKALRPARFKRGRNTFFRTDRVAQFITGRPA